VSDADIGAQLAAWGKVAIVETRGRRTGAAARAAVGFIEEPDGSLLVAAGDPEADWAFNLDAHPGCRVTIGEAVTERVAEPLDPAETNATIAGLILRYGTPAERLGRGPAFRLRLADAGSTSSVADGSIPSDDFAGGRHGP
jgi:deazaflavin-dependent oxidoreductase (nitroreductase family)